MNCYVGVTDESWFNTLRSNNDLSEINFWQPGGKRQFRALGQGELFLFKLRSPKNYIVGGAFFQYSTLLPISLAWQSFGIGNGVRDLKEMRERTNHYRKTSDAKRDFTVGCVLLSHPFYIPENSWIPVPSDWKPNIVQGKTYDLMTEPGLSLSARVKEFLSNEGIAEREVARYGTDLTIKPRLGQGVFRIMVTDAYDRKCAVSGEKVLPVLEAAHVKPYAEGGDHKLDNGVLLKSDLHTLFDRGYLTVTVDYRLEVSSRIRLEFENGKAYYAYQGNHLQLPKKPGKPLARENLVWHNENVYLG